ncbi:MAG: glycoside hydrolase family 43 protein [Anaerolineae bacterium]|nr:glycoside hydrolase family 43 protein [Anaerolineae bacterium]
MQYRNPILSGMYPDPSICRVEDEFYLVTSTFCYFPGVPIFHSRDLIHWRQIGHCLNRDSQLNLKGKHSAHGIYAPTIRYHEGTFYMVTTLVGEHGGNFYVTTDDPTGSWSDPVWLEQEGIDPTLYFEDGRVYLLSTGTPSGIYMSEIDLLTGKCLTTPRLLWGGMGGRYPEGPHLYRIDAYYYLMISEGGTEYAHRLTMARSTDLWGPYTPCPHNPIFSHQDHPNSPFQATGHGDLVMDKRGKWWLVCLAIRPSTGFPTHHLGRETLLLPAAWDEAGWLVINQGKLAALMMEADTLPAFPYPDPPSRDTFEGASLDLRWNFIRNPPSASWSLVDHPRRLRLLGQSATLDDGGSPTFIGQRQSALNCQIRTQFSFLPAHEGEEAGIALYQNEHHHYEFGVTRRAGERVVFVRQRIGVLSPITFEHVLAEDSSAVVTLRVEASPLEYRFVYTLGDGIEHPAGIALTRYLSSEVAGGFTGVFVGMYAISPASEAVTPADFHWFELISQDE